MAVAIAFASMFGDIKIPCKSSFLIDDLKKWNSDKTAFGL